MYFEKQGKVNTKQTLELAFKRGKELGLNEVVIASTSGDTAFEALAIFKGFTITAATYHCGFKEPFKKIMPHEVMQKLQQKNVNVIMATHALSGLERSVFKTTK